MTISITSKPRRKPAFLGLRFFLMAALVFSPAGILHADNFLFADYIGNIRDCVLPLRVQDRTGKGWIGSGFLIEVSSHPDAFRFLVTARHVIEGKPGATGYGHKLTLLYNRNLNSADHSRGRKPIFSDTITISTSPPSVNVGFPRDTLVDIAAVYLQRVRTEGPEQIAARAQEYISATSEDAPEEVWIGNAYLPFPKLLASPISTVESITEVVFLGFPFGVNAEQWGHPLLRSAVVATPTTIGYSNKNYGPHAFMIDNGPVPGDSGGPVFSKQLEFTNYGTLHQARIRLLGITSKEVTLDEVHLSKGRYREAADIDRTKINLGVAYPARFIKDAISALNIVPGY